MARPGLTILWGADEPVTDGEETEVVSALDFRKSLFEKRVLPYLFRYGRVDIVTNLWGAMPHPLLAACVARAVCRGRCRILDHKGFVRRVSLLLIATLSFQYLWDLLSRWKLISRVRRNLAELETVDSATAKLDLRATPIYFRTDLVYKLRAGGSVGHIAGVLNNIDVFARAPVFLTTDHIPTVREDVVTHLIPGNTRFRDFRELPLLDSNRLCRQAVGQALSGRSVSFVYQRYSLLNYAGLRFAQEQQVPFILEYNGSEVWVAKNWGRGTLKYEQLAEEVEMANLHGADVVVVVSQPMLDELRERGVDEAKVLVNPNGVNPDYYSPNVDGSAVRQKYELVDKTVIGFIGTFHAWHGAQVLADAFGRLVQQTPGFRDFVRLLLIGDGVKMPEVKENLRRHNVADLCVLTGQVPQRDGPAHLAACDLLASPHVPNPDGTPFFGSPTKLFEYMAMGKGIVASNLDQIGEILEHKRTAWMVQPGDPDALAAGLRELIQDKALRERLGVAAREEVVARYTWKEHTRRIIAKLKERCG